MEVETIVGQRLKSQFFYVRELNHLYLKRNSKSDSKQYLYCYHDKCKASGLIQNGFFYVVKEDHNDHERGITTCALLSLFKFYNELRNRCAQADKPPKVIFEEVYEK